MTTTAHATKVRRSYADLGRWVADCQCGWSTTVDTKYEANKLRTKHRGEATR